MKRVVLVVWGFEAFGGMERHVCELALALRAASVDVAVVSEMPVARANFYARRLRSGGVPLLAPPWPLRVANGLAIALAPSSRSGRLIHGGGPLSRRLRRVLARLTARGDVLHIHGCRLGQSWLIDWARERGIATVYTEHVAIGESGGPLAPDGPRLAAAAGVVACVSDQSRRDLSKLFPQPPPIAVTDHIVGDVARPGPPIADRPPTLICVARLSPYKGIDTLLAAMALLGERAPDVRLTIVGDGPLDASLRHSARGLKIADRVTFAGRVSPDRVTALVDDAAAVVIPSRSEGLPLALIEAMACGKAIVATRAGGIPEAIEDGVNGLLVPIDDAAALADALAAIIADPALRLRLGAAARRTFERGAHAPERVVGEMLRLYRAAEARC